MTKETSKLAHAGECWPHSSARSDRSRWVPDIFHVRATVLRIVHFFAGYLLLHCVTASPNMPVRVPLRAGLGVLPGVRGHET